MAEHMFPARPATPTTAQMRLGIEACLTVQRRARSMGKRPFAAVLIGPDNETVLLTHQSVDHVNHAESSLARLAACHYTQEYLWQSSETQLQHLTGQGNEENMTMALPCRKVIEGSQKDIKIIGPLEDMDQIVVQESDEYWKPIREAKGF